MRRLLLVLLLLGACSSGSKDAATTTTAQAVTTTQAPTTTAGYLDHAAACAKVNEYSRVDFDPDHAKGSDDGWAGFSADLGALAGRVRVDPGTALHAEIEDVAGKGALQATRQDDVPGLADAFTKLGHDCA